MSWQQKLTKRRLLGRTFVKKKPKLDGFWDPWGGHWEGLGWNFGPKKGKQKKHEKKGWKPQASAGHADPGKEGLEGQTSRIQHAPNPSFGDGRADCLRFAHPAEATQSSEARWLEELKANRLRGFENLEGLEATKLRCLEKLRG